MTANKASPRDVLVLDMSSLRFRWTTPERGCVSVLSTREEVLAVIDADPSEPLATIAFRAMDDALARATVLRADPHHPAGPPLRLAVALYNPLTGEVSLGAVPATVAYTAGERLTVDAAGTLARTSVDDDGETVLVVGDLTLHPVRADRDRGDRIAASAA